MAHWTDKIEGIRTNLSHSFGLIEKSPDLNTFLCGYCNKCLPDNHHNRFWHTVRTSETDRPRCMGSDGNGA